MYASKVSEVPISMVHDALLYLFSCSASDGVEPAAENGGDVDGLAATKCRSKKMQLKYTTWDVCAREGLS